MHFGNGGVSGAGVTAPFEVRCVRASALVNALPGRYVTSEGGGVVTDTWTKLQWQRGTAGSKIWSNAKTDCASLSLEGSGWRLPWVRELFGLVDVEKGKLTIDLTAFPGTPMTTFWSASPLQGNSSAAWDVNFNSGKVNGGGVSATYQARCVRGS